MKRKTTAVLMTLALLYGMIFAAPVFSAEDKQITETFIAGTGTWTVPEKVTLISVQAFGGGGGAAAPIKNNTGSGGGGGGGGGGGYSAGTFSVTAGQTFYYSVGAGGPADGENGGDTVFGTLTAGGGQGTAGTSGGAGGSGDPATGGSGADAGENYGGGGGAGGGGDGSGKTGGMSFFGGNGGDGGEKDNNPSGQNGFIYGGGAGGSFRQSDSFGNTGQTGAPGILVISYKKDTVSPSRPFVTLQPDDGWTNSEQGAAVTVVSGKDEEGGSGFAYTEVTLVFPDETRIFRFTGLQKVTYVQPEGVTEIIAVTYDKAGNASEAAERTVRIDRTKPNIAIGNETYEDGAVIDLGYIATDYNKSIPFTKTDGLSGFAPDGSLSVTEFFSFKAENPGLDLQQKVLTVTDKAGNSASFTFTYTVIGMGDPVKLLDPVRDGRNYKTGSNIPVKLQILGEDGLPVPMPAGDLTFALKLYDPDENEIAPSRTNKAAEPGSAVFTLSPDGLTYQYNLNTKDLKPEILTLEIYIADKADSEEGLVGIVYLNLKK